ncbi:MAG: amino acid-binding protein [Desulfovibrionaceae bacterium]|nr:amino acid-binding protein [Desulfovibrionaceae bacterium]
MNIVVSILGPDRPGVVYVVSAALSGLRCNIEEISQTILQGQFAAIFIADMPADVSQDTVHSTLMKAIAARDMNLSVIVRPLREDDAPPFDGGPSEPFVITLDGEDRLDMVSSFARVFAEHKVNIENMKALMPDAAEPGSAAETRPRRALLMFEVALPLSLDRPALRRTLEDKARGMGLRVSMQHRDIFEALHRVEPF